MSDDRPSEVLGALPRTRPHRRSQKRAARPVTGTPTPPPGTVLATESSNAVSGEGHVAAAAAKRQPGPRRLPQPDGAPPAAAARRLPQPAQPDGAPPAALSRNPAPPSNADFLGTAVHAAAELAEISLSVSARALRRAVSRLPRP